MEIFQTESFISSWIENLPYSWKPFFESGQRLVLKKHEFLYHQDQAAEYVYIVLEGRIRLFLLSPSGEEKAISIIGKNGLLGECGVFGYTTYNSSAITASKTSVIKVSKQVFIDTIQENLQLSNQVFQIMNIKNRILSTHTMILSHYSAVQRICYTLGQLVHTYGIKKANGNLITIKFTHQELANLVGTSRVTVAKTMKLLENKGFLMKIDGKYLIVDIKGLNTLLINLD